MSAALLCRRVVARVPPGIAAVPARLRIAHLLDTADLRPAGLPPRAVLLIRRVRAADPLVLDGFRAGRGWEAATRARIAAWHRRALRPRRGRVPPDAEAVLFADEAEWLAALACIGGAGQAPWWAEARGVAAPASASMPRAAAAWQEAPHGVPAAVTHLAAWGELRVLANWPEEAAARILAALRDGFALPDLWPVASPELASVWVLATPSAQAEHATRDAPACSASTLLADIAPPAAAALATGPAWTSLPIATRVLAIVAITLARAPRALRQPGAPHWIAQLAATPHSAGPTGMRPAATPEPSAEAPRARPVPGAPMPAGQGGDAAPPGPREAEAPLRAAAEVRQADAGVEAPGRWPRPGVAAAIEPPPQDGIATRLGGLFLLLDLVLRAGLPDIFAGPLDLPRRVSGWALLELLGRALLTAEHARDPAWGMLAELDGRGADEALPPLPRQDFRIPPGWIPPDGAAWVASAPHGRLRIRHPAGEVILDRRIGQDGLSRALDAERKRLGPQVPAGASKADDATAEAWRRMSVRAVRSPGWPSLAAGLVPCLLAQAARRIGCDRADAVAALRDVALRPARVHAAPAHLDLVFRLDAVSVPARRAGLDADPGWVPELMRVVRFHFE